MVLLAWLSTLAPAFRGLPFHFEPDVIAWHLGYLNAFVHKKWLNPVFWTLAIECQIYLLIAVLYPLVVSDRRSLRIGIPLVLLGASFLNLGNDVVTTHLHCSFAASLRFKSSWASARRVKVACCFLLQPEWRTSSRARS